MVESQIVVLDVAGSNPVGHPMFSRENEGFRKSDTDLAQKATESGPRKVKFPQVIRYRNAEATIYGKSPHYPRYRLAVVSGNSNASSYATFR